MRKQVVGCLVSGIAIFASFAPVAFAQGPGRPGGPMAFRGGGRGERVVTGAPFSATEVRTFQERLGDGNLISRTSQVNHYRDSQGRTRTEETITPAASSGKQAFVRASISDPVAGQRHELDSSSMTARTTKVRPAPASSSATGTRAARAP